jgi:hypothetical protein
VTRPIFGVTDSPRVAERKRRAAERAEADLQRDRAFLPIVERGPDGEPERLYLVRNPHYRGGERRVRG